jgi:hypothetical protein
MAPWFTLISLFKSSMSLASSVNLPSYLFLVHETSKCTVTSTLIYHSCFVSSFLCNPLICKPVTDFTSFPTYCSNTSKWNESPKEFHAKTCLSLFFCQFQPMIHGSLSHTNIICKHPENALPLPCPIP